MKKFINFLLLFFFLGISGFTYAQTINTSIDPNFVQIPRLSVVPTCAVADKGKLYFNSTNNKMFFCNM